MAWFLYVISTVWIAFGSCAILYPPQTRQAARSFIAMMHPKVLAIFPFVGGLLFFMAASASSHPWIIRTFGLLAFIKGIFLFFNPGNLYAKTMEWYFEKLSDQAHRLIGLLSVILGTALLSWVL